VVTAPSSSARTSPVRAEEGRLRGAPGVDTDHRVNGDHVTLSPMQRVQLWGLASGTGRRPSASEAANHKNTRDRRPEVVMTRKVIDCRDFPSESGCTLAISGVQSELLQSAAEHTVVRAS
jgi:hypothetical protein